MTHIKGPTFLYISADTQGVVRHAVAKMSALARADVAFADVVFNVSSPCGIDYLTGEVTFMAIPEPSRIRKTDCETCLEWQRQLETTSEAKKK